MGNIKQTHVTKEHCKAIRRLVELYQSQAKLARFLGVNAACIHTWLKGAQVIPFHHAEKIVNDNKKITMLEIRPDLKKYEKYLK